MKDGFKKNKNRDGIMSDGTMVQCCDKYMHGRKDAKWLCYSLDLIFLSFCSELYLQEQF